jgi:negative regulator of flagellin synthesis FlgM
MDLRISGVYQAYEAQASKRSPRHNAPAVRSQTESDKITISSQAGEYQAARQAVANTPDVRQEVMDRIRTQLENGTYRVSAQDVAASIFRELV